MPAAHRVSMYFGISQHKGPVTRKMFPFDDVIMENVNGHVRVPYIYLGLAHEGSIINPSNFMNCTCTQSAELK